MANNILITGGARSGKSRFAEEQIRRFGQSALLPGHGASAGCRDDIPVAAASSAPRQRSGRPLRSR
jgi:hypothetical protein